MSVVIAEVYSKYVPTTSSASKIRGVQNWSKLVKIQDTNLDLARNFERLAFRVYRRKEIGESRYLNIYYDFGKT